MLRLASKAARDRRKERNTMKFGKLLVMLLQRKTDPGMIQKIQKIIATSAFWV
jgi:hypothetical protein